MSFIIWRLPDRGNDMLGVLIQLLIVLLIVGVILWGIQQFPIDPTIQRMVKVVIIVAVAIYLIYLLASVLGGLPAELPAHR